jgi:hypothetical protein
MKDKMKIALIAPEVSGLWNTYNEDSMVVCVLKCFLNTVEDKEARCFHILLPSKVGFA